MTEQLRILSDRVPAADHNIVQEQAARHQETIRRSQSNAESDNHYAVDFSHRTYPIQDSSYRMIGCARLGQHHMDQTA